MSTNIEPKWRILEEGELLRPGDELSTLDEVWLPVKIEWGWRVPLADRYRRRVFQLVNIPWLERKITECRANLKTEISREQFAYQTEALWASLANSMALTLEKFAQIAAIEQAATARKSVTRQTDLESTQTA